MIEHITVTITTYLRGEIKAKYSGEFAGQDSIFEKSFLLEIYEAEIINGETFQVEGEFIQTDTLNWIKCPDIKRAKVNIPDLLQEGEVFQLDLNSVQIASPKLSNVVQEDINTYGELIGTIQAIVDVHTFLKPLGEIEDMVAFASASRIEELIKNRSKGSVEVLSRLRLRNSDEPKIRDLTFKTGNEATISDLRLVGVSIESGYVNGNFKGDYNQAQNPLKEKEDIPKKTLGQSTRRPSTTFGEVIRSVLGIIPLILAGLFIASVLWTVISSLGTLLGWKNFAILAAAIGVTILLSQIITIPGGRWIRRFKISIFEVATLIKISKWIVWGLFLFFLFSSFTVLAFVMAVLGLIISIVTFGRAPGISGVGVSGLGGIAALIIGIAGVATFLGSTNKQYTPEDRQVYLPVKTDTVFRQQDSINVSPLRLIHHLQWTDLRFNKNEGEVEVFSNDMEEAKVFMTRYRLNSRFDYTELYSSILKNEGKQHQSLFHLFDSIQKVRNYNEYEFAGLIVTMVQEIPYTLILEESCPDIVRTPCVPYVPFGLYTPKQFTYTLDGDCDTRVLLLYALLDHYGYQVAILCSDFYSHAMLGIALPGSGYYLEQNNIRYYFWETTSKGWGLGQLNPASRNLSFWYIALTNQ